MGFFQIESGPGRSVLIFLFFVLMGIGIVGLSAWLSVAIWAVALIILFLILYYGLVRTDKKFRGNRSRKGGGGSD